MTYNIFLRFGIAPQEILAQKILRQKNRSPAEAYSNVQIGTENTTKHSNLAMIAPNQRLQGLFTNFSKFHSRFRIVWGYLIFRFRVKFSPCLECLLCFIFLFCLSKLKAKFQAPTTLTGKIEIEIENTLYRAKLLHICFLQIRSVFIPEKPC